MSSLVAGNNAQPFCRCHLRGGYHRADSRWIYGTGFLHEHMFPCFYGSLELLRPEMCGGAQQHQLHLRHGHHFLIGIKAEKAIAVINLVVIFSEDGTTSFHPVRKEISQSDDFKVRSST